MPGESNPPAEQKARGIPHDQLFKTLCATFFLELVELFDPELAASLDPESLLRLDTEFHNDFPEGRRRRMDLVFQARWRLEQNKLLIFFVELERRYREIHPGRMAEYYLGSKLRHFATPIVPIALYLEGGPPRIDIREWKETVGELTIFHFRYHALGLSGSLAEDYLKGDNPIAYALAALMRSKIYDRPELKLECLRRIVGAKLDESRTFLLANIVETYLELSQDEQIRYDRQLEDSNDAEEVKIMQMTWADKMVAKGREEGLSMGIARGQLQGARQVLAGQIEYRFGSLSDACRHQLERIEDPQEIDRLARRLVEARSLQDLGLDDAS